MSCVNLFLYASSLSKSNPALPCATNARWILLNGIPLATCILIKRAKVLILRLTSVLSLCLDISNILNQATIGVLSSKSEGLPVSLLEYGLAKLPVVVTNVGECGKVVENGKSGIVVEKENSLELADALDELINSEEKRKEYAELHYNNVIEKYSENNSKCSKNSYKSNRSHTRSRKSKVSVTENYSLFGKIRY